MCIISVPVWQVARYMCISPPYITGIDGYSGTNTARLNLSSVALKRARKFYSDRQMSSTRISSVVQLEYGQCGDIESLEPCTKVFITNLLIVIFGVQLLGIMVLTQLRSVFCVIISVSVSFAGAHTLYLHLRKNVACL